MAVLCVFCFDVSVLLLFAHVRCTASHRMRAAKHIELLGTVTLPMALYQLYTNFYILDYFFNEVFMVMPVAWHCIVLIDNADLPCGLDLPFGLACACRRRRGTSSPSTLA